MNEQVSVLQASGALQPGGLITEGTAGSTGVSLAMVRGWVGESGTYPFVPIMCESSANDTALPAMAPTVPAFQQPTSACLICCIAQAA
jgi:hypothetical protein